jgi:two-component system cell cycle response regulator DivK
MPKRILLVEDNAKNRLLIRDILNYYGYEVIEAEDGAKGLKLAREQLPDLILMDLQMPVMDGCSAGRILKNDPLTMGIKIIALTSFAVRNEKEKVLAAGFEDYIEKPIDTRQFLELIRVHLGEN